MPDYSNIVFPVVYIYIGEMMRMLEQRVSEHQGACRKGKERESVVAWKEHPILWQEARVINRTNRHELKVKHIYLGPVLQPRCCLRFPRSRLCM